MPLIRSKKRRLSPSVKHKKNITSRLMMISLRADDYIYKNKQIPIKEAEAYAQEIASFKKLYLDERYLQVIEKLTSHMNYIIKEQTSNDIIKVTANKPIEIESHKDNTVCHKHYANSWQKDTIVENISNKSVNIVLNTEENNNYKDLNATPNSNFIVNQDVDMEKAKNLYDTANKFILHSIDREISKDVVGSVCDVQNVENKIVNTTDGISLFSQDMPTNIEQVPTKDTNAAKNQIQQIKEILPNVQCTGNTKNVIKKSITKRSTKSNACIIVQKVNKKRVQKKTLINDKNAIKKLTMKTNSEKSKIDSNSSIEPRNTINGKNDPIMANVGHAEDRVNTSKAKKNKRNPKKRREAIDLSWVEDLKFIREIDKEEHIILDNLGGSFWEDFSLPSNLNIKDFDEYDNINIWKN